MVVSVLGYVPAFYRTCSRGTAEDGRRLISRVAAIGSAMGGSGTWNAAVTETEINGWLRTDLPKNHSGLLPAGVSDPRVNLADDMVRVGARVGWGPVAAVASLGVRIDRLDADRVRADVRSVRIGGLPLPRGPAVRRLAAALTAAGMPTELQRVDGRSVAVVYISGVESVPGKTHRLDTLDISGGELLLSGATVVTPAGGRR